MTIPRVIQGRLVTPADVAHIRTLVATHPEWSRRQLSERLAADWDWRTAAGRLKDMATRTLLLKLDAQGVVTLPPRRRVASNRMAHRPPVARAWDQTPVAGPLAVLGPLAVSEVSGDGPARQECAAALATFHYLGYRGPVGETLLYAVRQGDGRLLACLVFGAAAWACRSRDAFIGWSPAQRAARLAWLTNNTRFLILPWVRVPHLASWIQGHVLRRLSADWQRKYGHPIALVETFVERDRFVGTSYRAANWRRLGATTGRSRQDRYTTLHVPVKDVYVYALCADVRTVLAA
jgi:hypothetical protein